MTQISGRPRVAFVVQRCGLEVNGGAELHCLQIAQRMARYWDTEILTTCALDYMRWHNFYPTGEEMLGSTLVRRFPVDTPRDVAQFDRLSHRLHFRSTPATLNEQEKWMCMQGPLSSQLLDFLRVSEQRYDAFIFFGYLYATTYFGLPLVRNKAWLAPLAHDEWPIHLSMWDFFFATPIGFLFNTEPERTFLQKRFPALPIGGAIIGVGIEPPRVTRPQALRQRYSLRKPFLLYMGRIDESKGCSELLDFFIRARSGQAIDYQLVFVGKEVMPIPYHEDVIHLGFLPEEEKWDVIAAADWLVMPSEFESLSMALLEGWSLGIPAIVNARSEVLRDHCATSGGGLWYMDFAEWKSILSLVNQTTMQKLGEQGRRYVQERYCWGRVENAYLACISPLTSLAPL